MTLPSWLEGYTNADVEIAAILEPPPDSDASDIELGEWFARLESAAIDNQRMAREGDGDDPVLGELSFMRDQVKAIRDKMVLLVAYAREKSRPRYTLDALASAAGLSKSGVRTFYDASDIERLEAQIAYARENLASSRVEVPAAQSSAR